VAQLYAVTPLQKPRRFHPFRPCRERRRRTAPAQRLDFLEEWRIGAQRREIPEKQREIALLAKDVYRKFFDRTVAVQKLAGAPAPSQGYLVPKIDISGKVAGQPQRLAI